MFLLRCAALFWLSAWFVGSACAAAALEWRFKTAVDANETPHTDVTLVIDGRTTLVEARVVGAFRALDRANFRDRGVPADALLACSGWWAGGGDEYYVRREGRVYAVYHRGLDEGSPVPRYRLKMRVPAPVP